MAESPALVLNFDPLAGCGDCGYRSVVMPRDLPLVGDDFPWGARDYDGLRQFMLEELVARFPERSRWTAADMEVVLIEVMAAMLDQFSDAADKVFREGVLETAQQPPSVRRFLKFIGFNAFAHLRAQGRLDTSTDGLNQLGKDLEVEKVWRDNPFAMDEARKLGVDRLFDQARMVTLADYGGRLDDHPLVTRVNARSRWTGAWQSVDLAVILADTSWTLDQSFASIPVPADPVAAAALKKRVLRLQQAILQLHLETGAALPLWENNPTFRFILRNYLEALRLAGQPVTLHNAVPTGIAIVASLVLKQDYFHSEVKRAAEIVLGSGPQGFFRAGNLRFGEDLFASDLIARLMDVAGVENVCLIRFKRVGGDYPDESETGRIKLDGLEVAICDNIRGKAERGYLSLKMNGGRRG
jgi:hypothetical protein